MGEYTPTTDEVRAMYVTSTPPHRVSVSAGNAEFDRWLAAEKAKWQTEVVQEIIDFLGAQQGDARLAARLVQAWHDRAAADLADRLVKWWQNPLVARIVRGDGSDDDH